MRITVKTLFYVLPVAMLLACSGKNGQSAEDRKIDELMAKMTLQEKIGQMNQLTGLGLSSEMIEQIKAGSVGSILNEIDPATVNELQRVAVEESRLGIPLIIARDVVHGFKTIFPIPLAQAASWNPEVAESGARVAAIEAASVGVRWTFAPMIDIARDARWGRMIEGLGEDPYLTSVLGVAMVKGFQGDSLSSPSAMAACVKHFCGYGASEGGRDYNTTYISEEQLRNTYLPPFKAAVDAGAATLMTAFNDLNGVPCSGNSYLINDILRKEWNFDGLVVSDWGSVQELIAHGYCADDKEAAEKGTNAGVEMDMMGHVYSPNLETLIKEGKVKEESINQAVRNILKLKYRLGLFDNPYVKVDAPSVFYAPEHLKLAKEAAEQSCVLLKNENNLLPLTSAVKSIAVIGPMADAPHDQMGSWVFDGEKEHTVTPIQALRDMYGQDVKINYVKALEYSRDEDKKDFAAAVNAARNSDVVLFFAGEESILTGEARCRADISLPGAQKELLKALDVTGKPIVLVMLAGRPVEIEKELPMVDAFLYAWHPGTMGGPAIADLLFGKVSPSGKLPVTYPKMVGQIPIYYNHKSTGRPASGELGMMNTIPVGATQTSLGHTSYYLDAGAEPLYPFGYGLTYTTFAYNNLQLSDTVICPAGTLTVTCNLKNTGEREAVEVAQLYVCDLVGSITRPVKELKRFERISLKPGESKQVSFNLSPEDLSFWNDKGELLTEAGDYKIWIGPNSQEGLEGAFSLK